MVDALLGARVIGELYEAFLLEEEKCAGLVGVVSGDDDGCAGLKLGEIAHAVAVDAERLIVDLGSGDEVSAVGSVEAVQVRGVLEVVGVERAVRQGLVGQDIVVIGDDLELVALVGKRLLDLLEDLCVRGGGGADLQHFQLAVGGLGSGGIGGGSSVSGLALGCAAGEGGNDQQSGKNDCKYPFHDNDSFLNVI